MVTRSARRCGPWEAGEDPARVELLAQVRPAVDADEVAGAWVHRQPCLCGEVPVVPLDQVVHHGEVPALCEPAPGCGELGGILERLGEHSPRLLEPALVLLDGVLNRAQPAHPGGWPTERAHARIGVGPEVPQALPERLPAHRARLELGLELLALAAL